MVTQWQKELLLKEISEKERLVKTHDKKRLDIGFKLKDKFFFIDFNFVLHFIYKSISSYIKDVKCTHANKLFNLGVPFNVYGYDVDKVVKNFSNYSLSKKEKEILAYGLEHNISAKLSKIKYFTHFEMLTNILCEEPLFNITKDDFISRLKEIGYDVFRKCKKEKKISLFTEEDIGVLKFIRGKRKSTYYPSR